MPVKYWLEGPDAIDSAFVEARAETHYSSAMPAPAGPLLGFALGALLAFTVRRELGRAREQGGMGSFLTVTACFSVLVFAPLCTYFVVFAPDWSLAYLVDARRLPRGFEVLLALVNAASVPLGFAARAEAPSEHLGPLAKVAGLPALLALGFILGTLPRLSVVATYAEFHGDFGIEDLAGSTLGHALLWMAAVLALGLGWTIYALRHLRVHPS